MMRGGAGGGNRGMRRMMDKMGLDMSEVSNVQEVIIKTDKKEIIVPKPTVNEMSAKDSVTFIVSAPDFEERELETPFFSEEDIKVVCDQTGADEERAKNALEEADGNIARAILFLNTQS